MAERLARRRTRHVLALVLATTLAWLAAVAPAHADTSSSVAIFSDPGDSIGQGTQQVFAPPDGSTIKVEDGSNASFLSVDVDDASGSVAHLAFGAPTGQTLQPGFYEQQLGDFNHGSIWISENGRACGTRGRFEVRDVQVDDSGVIQRAWIVFEQHCESWVAGLFGELRINEPVPDESAATVPRVVRWPAADFGGVGTPVPVTLVARARTTIASTALAGTDASAFAIQHDDCTGRTLSAGERCEVWVAFAPDAPGTRVARVALRDDSGTLYETALNGYAYGGRTRVVIHGEGAADGPPTDYSYTPASAVIAAAGSRQEVRIRVNGSNGDSWSAYFDAPPGDILAPGNYSNSGGGSSAAQLSVTGERHCGYGTTEYIVEFSVTEATFYADGRLRSFGADFEQRCEGDISGLLRGTFEYRIGNTLPTAPWMAPDTGFSGTVVDPPPLESDSGTTDAPTPQGSGSVASGDSGGTADGSAPASETTTIDRPDPGRTTTDSVARAQPPGDASREPAVRCHGASYLGYAVLRGSGANDPIRGTRKGDVIFAGAGDDTVAGLAGGDCIEGGPGRDHLNGGAGADVLSGGTGNDVLRGGTGSDVLDCGPGIDVAYVDRGDKTRGCERLRKANRSH